MLKMIEVQASALVPGKRYYIERIHPYPNQCNKFRGRFIRNTIMNDFITSYFEEVLSVTPSLAHTHTWPIFRILHLEFRYYQCSQDKAEEDREKRKNAAIAILNDELNEDLRKITGDPYFHFAKIPK